MKIWLDDVRPPPDDTWTWAKDSESAISLLRYSIEPITEVSLDYDLGLYDTGEPVAVYLATLAYLRPQIIVHIHSMNPVGRKRLEAALRI